ncbi:hypothetical protein CY652_01525 [Burkholderia sp. WAC0059]|nr:hypothetical protein CY652_01525 [Burkholderia sp. WAC0059]
MGTIKDVLQHPSARLTQHLRLSIGTVESPLDVLEFEVRQAFNEIYTAQLAQTAAGHGQNRSDSIAYYTNDAFGLVAATVNAGSPSESLKSVNGLVARFQAYTSAQMTLLDMPMFPDSDGFPIPFLQVMLRGVHETSGFPGLCALYCYYRHVCGEFSQSSDGGNETAAGSSLFVRKVQFSDTRS